MAVINSNEYDHIDVQTGFNVMRHPLKDTVARTDIDYLASMYDE